MANPYGNGAGATVDTIFGANQDDPYTAALKKLQQPAQVYGNNQTAPADFSGVNNQYAGQDPNAAAATINNMAAPTTNPYAPQTVKSDTSAITAAQANDTGTYAPTQPTTTVDRSALNTNIGPSVASGLAGAQASNADVLQALQNKAITGNQSAIDPLLQQKTTDLLNNPYFGYDFAKNKQTQLEANDQSRAQALEAMRRKAGDTLDTGATRTMLLDQALQGNTERANLANTIDTSNFNNQLNAFNNSLEQGRQTSKNASDILAQGVQNLATASGQNLATSGQNLQALQTDASNKTQLAMQGNSIQANADALDANIAATKRLADEGYQFSAEQNSINRALDAAKYITDVGVQKDMLNMKATIDRGDLIAKADIDKQMQAIELAKATALQNGDVQGKMALDTLSAQLDAVKTATQEKYQTAERMATQRWTSDQAMTQDQIDLAGKYLDGKMAEARQNNDIDQQKWVETQKEQHDLDVQLNGQNFDEKMTNLKYNMDEAKANNDVGRQKTILTYQANIQYAQDEQKFGHDTALKNLDGSIQTALQNNDFSHAKILQDQKIQAESTEHDKDLAISQVELELKRNGMDMANIQAAIDAGVADPKTLSSWLESKGVHVTAPDPYAASKAAAEKSTLMKNEYASTHPDLFEPVKDAQGNPTGQYQAVAGKEADANKQYNDYVNSSLYDEKQGQSATTKLSLLDPADLQGAASTDNPHNADYQAALKTAKTFDWGGSRVAEGFLDTDHTIKFNNPTPASGTSFKGADGKLYIVQSGLQTEKGNWTDNREYIEALDPDAGSLVKIYPNGSTAILRNNPDIANQTV
jgi:hypothetical protein